MATRLAKAATDGARLSPTETHRSLKQVIGKESGAVPLELVEVPPFLLDDDITREDIADYLFEIQWFDEELGRILALLKQSGQLDNTAIVYTSDNGMPFPRAKSNIYDYGTRVKVTQFCDRNISTPNLLIQGEKT